MITRGILQQSATGLLSLLGIKQRGQNPDAFGDTVLPVMDLTDWMHHTDSEFVVDSNLSFPVGESSSYFVYEGTPLQVPDTEVWYVHQMSLRFTLLAHDHFAGQLALMMASDPQQTNYVCLAQTDYVAPNDTLGVNSSIFLGFAPKRWFKGGTRFGMGYGYLNTAGGGCTAEVVMQITRLKI